MSIQKSVNTGIAAAGFLAKDNPAIQQKRDMQSLMGRMNTLKKASDEIAKSEYSEELKNQLNTILMNEAKTLNKEMLVSHGVLNEQDGYKNLSLSSMLIKMEQKRKESSSKKLADKKNRLKAAEKGEC